MTTTELIKPIDRDLKKLFTGKDATDLESVLSQVAETVRSQVIDMGTAKGRDACRALTMQVVHSKTGLEEAAVAMGLAAKQVTDQINARRRRFKAFLDDLRDEIREPLTDWEADEKARVDSLNAQIEGLRQIADVPADATPGDIEGWIERLNDVPIEPEHWQEFNDIAAPLIDDARKALDAALDGARKRESDEAELAELRAEKLQREETERAEAEAAQRKEEAEAAEAEAAERAEREEAARIEREAQIKADAEAAERRRIEEEAEAERKASERRAANKAHRSKVRREASRDLVKLCGFDVIYAEKLIAGIEEGKIRNVCIQF